MRARASIIALGLALGLVACTMDNPAFNLERGSGAADEESGDGDPSGPEESGESNDDKPGDGDGDGDPSESSSDDPTTDGDCVTGTSCGPCQVCDESGECVIDVGGACEGPQTHCANYLFGSVEGLCYRLVDVTLGGRCSEQGSCVASPASDCPYEQGAVHFACEPSCVTNTDACVKYGKASEIEMSAMCVVDGSMGPGCNTICANGIHGVVQHHGCFEGECQPVGVAEVCLGYLCNEQGTACHASCESNAQCAQQFTCSNSQQCEPG